MPKTYYEAIDPAGRVHKRSTDRRTYTHTVVFLPSYTADMARADKDYPVDGDNHDFHVKMVQWGGVYKGERRPWHTDEQIAADLAKYQALAAEYPSREAAIAGKRAERVAFVNARKDAGYYAIYQNAGWCGRLDLAQKLAAKTPGLSVTILEAKEAGR